MKNMIFTQKAQSTIEFSTLIILVTLGLIVMSPYIIRSVNAHLKTWEDSVDDSISDPLQNAPATGLGTP